MTNKLTAKSASRKAASLARKIEDIEIQLSDFFDAVRNMDLMDNDQALAASPVRDARNTLMEAKFLMQRCERHLRDTRTPEQVEAEQARLRAERDREATIKVYGCAP